MRKFFIVTPWKYMGMTAPFSMETRFVGMGLEHFPQGSDFVAVATDMSSLSKVKD